MTKLAQCARTTRSAAKRSWNPTLPPYPRLSHPSRFAYSSLHEASFITVMDDGYDASRYGYRIFIPSSPKRTNLGGVVTSSNVIRKSSTSAQQYQSFHYQDHHYRSSDYNDSSMVVNDEYAKCMQSIDPSTLDILSSPEVLAILESRRDWEMYKNDSDDPYLSDCEEMEENWSNDTPPVMSAESFDELPSIDEKKM